MRSKNPIGLGLLIGLLALAFAAVPASAMGATVTLKNAENEALAANAEVLAVSENLVTTTAAGTLECDEVVLEGNVTRNGEEEFAQVGNVTGEATGGGAEPADCKSSNPKVTGVTVTVNKVHPVNFWQNGQASSFARFTGVLHHEEAGDLTCTFEGVIGGSFTLGANLGLGVGPSSLTASGATCPVSSGSIEGGFTVTSGGEAVKVTVP